MSGDIAATVTGILAAQALVDAADIAPGATIESLGLDSLGMVEAIFAIEEAFDISVPFTPGAPGEAAAEFDISTVASIIVAVEGLVAQKAA